MDITAANAPEQFLSVCQEAQSEYIIDKSRFLGYTKPVSSSEEAEAYLMEIQAMHPEATHVVPAWIIGAGGLEMRARDDGEPAGTAGVPMLEVLKQEGLTDCIIISVRYFGGIKLGAGGLIRAYRRSAVETIQTAGICSWRKSLELRVSIPYSDLDLFEHRFAQTPWRKGENQFDSQVHLPVIIPEASLKEAEAAFAGWTRGTAQVEILRKAYHSDFSG